MNITEISPLGEQTIKNEGTAILGISVENSYFNEKNLRALIAWAEINFSKIYIMIPDEPAIYTMMAKGYSKTKASTKARLKANALENMCHKITYLWTTEVEIICWNSIQQNIAYKMSLAKVQTLYEFDTTFNQMVRSTTKEVLTKNSNEVLEESIDLGINFLFQELAFISNARQILGESLISYVYHKTMPVLQYVLDRHHVLQNLEVGCITLVNEL